MVGDVAKGAAASLLGGAVAGPVGAHVAGSSSVVGHCLPVWNGGRGGKGVAAGVGQCLATFPASVPIELAVAGATIATPGWTRRTQAASIAACACWVVAAVVWWRRTLPNLWGPRPTAALPLRRDRQQRGDRRPVRDRRPRRRSAAGADERGVA